MNPGRQICGDNTDALHLCRCHYGRVYVGATKTQVPGPQLTQTSAKKAEGRPVQLGGLAGGWARALPRRQLDLPIGSPPWVNLVLLYRL